MTVRSTPFWLITAGAGATVTAYTVPADRVAIVRTITIHNTGAVGAQATLTVNLGSGALAFWSGVVAALATVSLPVPLIIAEGDVVALVNGAAAGNMRSYGGGSLLAGDPQ